MNRSTTVLESKIVSGIKYELVRWNADGHYCIYQVSADQEVGVHLKPEIYQSGDERKARRQFEQLWMGAIMSFSWLHFFWIIFWILVVQFFTFKEGWDRCAERQKLEQRGEWHPRRVRFFGTEETRNRILGSIAFGVFIAAMIMGIVPLFAYEQWWIGKPCQVRFP